MQPAQRLLEAGCGHGVALDLIGERLETGVVVGVDRSPAMAAAARARNRRHIASGRAVVLQAALHEADLGAARFDAVLGLHFPPFLRGDGRRELAVAAHHLAPGGLLHVFAQPHDPARAGADARAVAARLAAHGLTVVGRHVEPVDGAAGVHVTAAAPA